MISIRKFEPNDLEQIQQLNFILWLSVQWNGAYHAEDTFVAVQGDKIVGVAAMFWDGTWYYLNRGVNHIPAYLMNLELCVAPDEEDDNEIRTGLLEKVKQQFNHYQQQYPDKKLVLRCWCMEDEKARMQDLLASGFTAQGITMILSYNLTKELPSVNEQEGISFGKLSCDEDGIKSYLSANEAGYDNVQDSEDELRFRLQGGAMVFAATKGTKVLSSCTIWNIDEGHYATENIFTVPEYRNKGLAKGIILTALAYLKEQGGNEATLTVLGTNRKAIALYLSMGYNLKANMIEMRYTMN